MAVNTRTGEEHTMKNSKKSAKTEVHADAEKEVRAKVNVYTLSAKAKKIDPKTVKAETHKGACLLALKKLGSAPFAAILSEVFRHKTIKTEMDTAKACRWMIGDMVRKGLVEVKN
jgi:hypothetical protein